MGRPTARDAAERAKAAEAAKAAEVAKAAEAEAIKVGRPKNAQTFKGGVGILISPTLIN